MPSQEIVPHNNNHTAQIDEYMRANEALADPVTRRDYFERMEADGFIDLTQQIASLVRTGDSNQHQHYDGEKVKLLTHEVPDQKDKEDLLRETWDTARGFLTDRELPDEDALEYAALTVAGGILLAHPFADGNGRTSRFVSYMIAKGEHGTDQIDAISESLANEWQVAPSGRIVKWEIPEYKSEQPHTIDWEFQFAGEAEDALDGAVAGSIYKDLIVRDFIDTAETGTKQLIETCVTRNVEGNLLSLDGDKLIEVLATDPEKGMGYAQKLLDLKRRFQAEYVRKYLETMRSDVHGDVRVFQDSDIAPPEDPRIKEPHVTAGSIKLYENRKARHEMITGVLGERAINGLVLPRDEAVAQHRAYSKYYRH